ncbi:MAG TPA: TonB-dependent receptor [Bryobacteraceae bacterium]|jgi:iron complex outermembrane receptor protein
MRSFFRVGVVIAAASFFSIHAQQSTDTQPASKTAPPARQPDVVVTGSWGPVPLEESDRSVNAYSLHNSYLLFGSLADALDLDSSVQVQSRAPNGIQGDLSIRGGSFEQTLVMLNGIRLSDAQSAHHNFDIPVPLDAIERIEVLRGSGSTLYGSEAVGGVVNVVTRPVSDERTWEMRLRAGYGSFGTNEESGFLAFKEGLWSQRFSFERELSDGFRDDREYRNLNMASESWLKTSLGLTRVFLSTLDKPFGADQFYGNYNSWERTKTWVATLSQDLGKNTLFSLGYRRHTDLYELLRDDPAYYTNRHEDETWDIAIRRHDALGKIVQVFYGAEGLSDHVDSNNLGVHSRKQGAVYGDVDIRSWRRFSFSASTRQEFYGRGQTIAIPAVSGGYWLSSKAKLRAAVNRSFRLPNYTDLYYHDPTSNGNPNLLPERAMNYEGGVDVYLPHRWRASATVFSRHENNDIDYIRADSSDIWQATNFAKLTFTGVEASLVWSMQNSGRLEIQYTGLHGAEGALNGYQSEYVFNYPTQQAVVSWERSSSRGWLARVRLGVTNQYQRNAYALVDGYLAWTRSPLHPYLRLTNLTNTDYQPVYGVVMPGRAALIGMEWCVLCQKR